MPMDRRAVLLVFRGVDRLDVGPFSVTVYGGHGVMKPQAPPTCPGAIPPGRFVYNGSCKTNRTDIYEQTMTFPGRMGCQTMLRDIYFILPWRYYLGGKQGGGVF